MLLVDTHEDSRAIYTIILEHHGFRVLAAAALDEGVRIARERRPDVIFLEYGFPRDGALQAVAVLRSHAATSAIPVVALSTTSAAEEPDVALAEGFTAYLVKPCAPMELLAEALRLCGGPDC